MDYQQFLERARPYFTYLKNTSQVSELDKGILDKFSELLLAKPLLADQKKFAGNLIEYLLFLEKGENAASRIDTLDWLAFRYAQVIFFEYFPDIKNAVEQK